MAFRGYSAGAGGAGGTLGYSPSPAKMKRKDLEEVSDDFSDFSLSSPARKIRRLDSECLPLIVEEEEPAVPGGGGFGHPAPEEQLQQGGSLQQLLAAPGPGAVGSPVACNEERALVVYQPPVNAPPLLRGFPSSSNVSSLTVVDPDVIAGFNNQRFWSGQRRLLKPAVEEGAEAREGDRHAAAASSCLAVVPWMPSRVPGTAADSATVAGGETDQLAEDAMESEDLEGGSMDVEEEGGQQPNNGGAAAAPPAMAVMQHWQQHCMAPQILSPATTSTPVMWSRG